MRKDETPVKKREFSLLLRGGLTIGAAVAVVLLWPQLRPLTVALLQKAALFTTVLDMPGGALETLRERYADQLLPEEPQPVPQPVDEVPEPANEEPPAAAAPEIPEEYRGKITELTMTGDDSPAYIAWKGVWLRNYTGLTAAEVEKVLAAPSRVAVDPALAEPQILLFHTHATESYEPYDSPWFDTRNSWRDADNQNNMVAVGAVLASGLEEAGLKVLHDDTQHDNPAYTGAYQRSNTTVKGYQKQYPHLQVLLDIHRDTTAVIPDPDHIVGQQFHFDMGTEPRQSLVDGIVQSERTVNEIPVRETLPHRGGVYGASDLGIYDLHGGEHRDDEQDEEHKADLHALALALLEPAQAARLGQLLLLVEIGLGHGSLLIKCKFFVTKCGKL